MKKFFKTIFKINPATIIIGTILLGVAAYLVGIPFIDLMELKTIDLRFISRGPLTPGDEIILAVVDEKSIEKEGKWPWPRTKMADLIDKLSEDGARVIGFDIGFLEPDENNTLMTIRRLQEHIKVLGIYNQELSKHLHEAEATADNDRLLADAIKRSRARVVLGYFFHMSGENLEHIDQETIRAELRDIAKAKYHMTRYTSQTARDVPMYQALIPQSNIPQVASATPYAGYFNVFPDNDGAIRWIPMVIQCGEKLFGPLSLQIVRAYLGGPPLSVKIARYGIEELKVGTLTIPTTEDGWFIIDYRGGAKTFPHISVSDILKQNVAPGTFQDKIVVVGATATGIYDHRVTPFSNVYSGLEIHANVINNILHQQFLHRPNWAGLFDMAAIVLLGLFLGLILMILRPVTGVLAAVTLFLAYLWLCRYLFVYQGALLNVTYPSAVLIVVYVNITMFKYATEERQKRWMRNAFSYYLSSSVVNDIVRQPERLKLGGEKKELSILFSDIRGFTAISEGLTPEALVHFMNKYLTAMTDVVFEYEGLLDKYIGDAIMAVFGAPVPQSNHAERACRTALGMLEALKELRSRWDSQNIPYIDIGIGINTGPMVVGNMGSDRRFDYTVMGDSVNLGSRLEAANKTYGTNIIISEFTYTYVSPLFTCRELDLVRVKGKSEPIRIYELIGVSDVPQNMIDLIGQFTLGLEKYKKQEWNEAIKYFSNALNILPTDAPSQLYSHRCETLKLNPPGDDWDGVFTMTTK
ncbi:MAG: adenylate/guanylate cyclase domain-containing protein [Pseudomonadota bacterium]